MADAFDAMVHDRPYREAMSPDTAEDELRKQRGKQFDPRLIDAFPGEDWTSLLRLAQATGELTAARETTEPRA